MARKDKKQVNKNTEDLGTEKEFSQDQDIDTKVETDKNEADELQIKFLELNDKFIRLYSEFENYRRRTAKEKNDLILTGTSEIMKDLLSVLDDFERAIEQNEKIEDFSAVKEGFLLIYNKFKKTLTDKGVALMESINTPFDTEIHEAVTSFPVQEEEKKGLVIDVVEKGYFLNDKVLRHAKVIVGQ